MAGRWDLEVMLLLGNILFMKLTMRCMSRGWLKQKNAYLKWRKEHPEVQTTPPANRKA
jgi:hypothetical protein